ncbi:EamA family transporter RarD [Sporolactobacillus sp. CQH2019]|uniref:EamA family transporter RarD n=1 Tax=Sporolactobacillus sp. CQH2019 TaxID=3023512 RepID=UPI0023676EFF|nr:EamA family transporter RarD [Sporolactobacillus sp. CQH2019]MDD9148719.1 EamA family transporter RarD [Sporolactobacillus sp. CQH2019]
MADKAHVTDRGVSRAEKRQRAGAVYAVLAYSLWGLLPMYWKLIDQVSAFEILAHRIFWAFIFMIILLIFLGRLGDFFRRFRFFLSHPANLVLIVAASILISINWLVYIWAVNNGHIVESSMGYYINPLVSILLGILFLKEKLTPWQIVAFLLATAGVFIQTIEFGQVPWIAISLALTFGFYGLTKKFIRLDAVLGLTFETLIVTPIAFVYLIYAQMQGTAAFGHSPTLTTVLLIGTGVVTALPLLFFAEGARNISLTMIGFFQYISPTLTLILGVTLYKESFSQAQLISFSFIWLGLLVFSVSPFMKRRLSPGRRPLGTHQHE